MTGNPTPDNEDILQARAEDIADGCQLHEVAIGIKQNTEAVMRAAIAAMSSATQARAAAKLVVDQKYDLLQTADAAGNVVLKNTRLRFVKLYGPQYNTSWDTAGWPGQSTSIPDSQELRFTLLNSVKNHYTANPAAESADMETTAAICGAAHAAISNARAAVNVAESNQTTAKAAQVLSVKSLRKRVRGLVAELGTLIADDDARYEAFGLNIPANPSAPEAIAGLTLSALGAGKVLCNWTFATRMESTRLLVKRVGVDPDFVSVGTPDGLFHVLEDYTAGQALEVVAIAYNDGGDAPPSPVASVTVT